MLEPTGRAGSDDGFDVRGIEIVRADEDSSDDDGLDDQLEPAPVVGSEDRLWLIQCKREKVIGPTKLLEYLEQYVLADGEQLHGLIFVAACDFSKVSRDRFNEKCREKGILEFYLWGKGELEDLLFQVKNDPLLFAYFGFSISIRQRSQRTALRSIIATKKRLKTVLTKEKFFVLRNSMGDTYPDVAKSRKFADDLWRMCHFEEMRHDGLEIRWASFLAYVDGDTWDAADAHELTRSHLYRGRWPRDLDANDNYVAASDEWNLFDENNKAWLNIVMVVPYERIVAIDDVGDEFYSGPQIYCRYENALPADRAAGRIDPVQSYVGPSFYVGGPADSKRIMKFSPQYRRAIE